MGENKRKQGFRKMFGFAGIWFCCLICLAMYSYASTGINVETHTADEIRQYIRNTDFSLIERPEYVQLPSTTIPFAPGKLTDVFM